MRRDGRPEVMVTDNPRSYGAALKEIDATERNDAGGWRNNRAENSHLPFRRRERAMLRFRQITAVHVSVANHFNQERSPSSRETFKVQRTVALAEWRSLCSG